MRGKWRKWQWKNYFGETDFISLFEKIKRRIRGEGWLK